MQSQYQRVTHTQWEVMKEFLSIEGKRKYVLRAIIDAIFWYLRLGSQWRNLPEGFPKWQLVYNYFSKWQKDGTLEKLNWGMNQKERKRVGKEATPSMVIIDSQTTKVAPFIAQDTGIDGNKKVNGRKRHVVTDTVVTDTLGLIWGVVVHAANLTDGVMAEKVVEPLLGYLHRMEKILADRAYKQVFTDWVYENMIGIELEISSPPPTGQGFVPVKWRWVGERTFGTFNFFRRLDKDHEKTTHSSEAWILWQNCQLILNRFT